MQISSNFANQNNDSQDIRDKANLANNVKKSSCLDEIEKLKINREERRKRMEDVKNKREEREKKNAALGHKVDVEFQAMVEAKKDNIPEMQPVIHFCKIAHNLYFKLAHPSRSTENQRLHKKEACVLKRA